MIMKKYNKKQLEEINNMLEKQKQSADIVIPIDCFRNIEIKDSKSNCQNQFFF